MRNVKLSKRYAKALFDLAHEKGLLDVVTADMIVIHETLVASRELLSVLNSPIINNDKKIAVLRDVFAAHVNEISLSFLKILATKNRESFLDEIAFQFKVLYKEHDGIKTATVKTPIALNVETKNQLLQLVINATQSKVELTEEIDKDMVGGIVLKFDGKEYDASVHTKMVQLRSEFNTNIYVGKY
ncbi:MAG: ATP synthase F1 subunit delta [Bacteroidota bacterium]